MALSDDAVKRLMIATGSAAVGNEVASLVNNCQAVSASAGVAVGNVIKATSTSQSTDFASLQLGDKIIHFPASAGGIVFVTCQTAYATGSVTYTSSNGAQTCTINGTQVSFADPGTDAQNATALAAAITANTTLNLIVTAVVDGVDPTKVNITSILPGSVGNYTLAVTGTGAARSGANLAGGAKVGELPVAAVNGDLYWVIRTLAAVPASVAKF